MGTKKLQTGRLSHRRRVYKNPPIEEAVCEFQFSNPENWNLIHSGLLLERVKKRYGGKPTEQRILRVTPPKGEASSALPPSVEEITKVKLNSVDGREIAAIGPGVLSVHLLKPYAGWEHFRSQIAEAFREYQKIGRPEAIRRIGVRYINRIVVPVAKGAPHEFFTTPPYTIPGIECSVDTYAIRGEYSLSGQSKVIVQLASIEAPPNAFGVVLDIDVSRNWKEDSQNMQSALKSVDELRDQERQVFEALITDKARDFFDA